MRIPMPSGLSGHDTRASWRGMWRLARMLPAVAVLLQMTFIGGQVARADVAPVTPPRLVPVPVSMTTVPGTSFTLGHGARIVVPPGANSGLSLAGDSALGSEGYRLDVAPDGVQIRAVAPAGLFYGVQTLRQLLPPWIESSEVQPGPWTVPAVHITDHPRYF